MTTYAHLVAALGHAYDSDPMRALLAVLPAAKPPRKQGGYRASLTFKPLGIYMAFDWSKPHWILSSVILYPGGVERFGAFPEPIEGQLPMTSTRADVQRMFGSPSRSGGTGAVGSFGIKNRYWDRYDRDGHSVRFEYDDSAEAIHIASLMSAQCAAKLNADLRTGIA